MDGATTCHCATVFNRKPPNFILQSALPKQYTVTFKMKGRKNRRPAARIVHNDEKTMLDYRLKVELFEECNLTVEDWFK